ncbi:Beta-glucuronosyltransferase GlcAT14B [Asimina triloba]
MAPSALSWEKMKMKGISPILHYRPSGVERRWILPLSVASLVSLLLLLFTTLSSPFAFISFYLFAPTHLFVESKLRFPAPVGPTAPLPPRLAYLISGSAGDGQMLRRTLQALYHPRNLYVVHLDLESPPKERKDLLDYVAGQPVFANVGNVRMITRANLVTYRGPTMVANTLHAAAILLREGGQWDWFINLSASDYPLVTQDGGMHLFYAFSHLPRDLNFIDHTSKIGWKEVQRAKPVIIDPGLYMLKKSDVFWITQRRSVPTAFKLFTVTTFPSIIMATSALKIDNHKNLFEGDDNIDRPTISDGALTLEDLQ